MNTNYRAIGPLDIGNTSGNKAKQRDVFNPIILNMGL